MSKISSETLRSSLREILNPEKKRNFIETIELQVGLKNYDIARDKRFSGKVSVPHAPRVKPKILIFGDVRHCDAAKALGYDCMNADEVKAVFKQKKPIKKIVRSYHYFLASASMVRNVSKSMGSYLTKAGKFPSVIASNDDVEEKVQEAVAQVQFKLKKLCLGVPIGNLTMTEDELVRNTVKSINFLISLLKKNWQNIGALYLHATMQPSYRIY